MSNGSVGPPEGSRIYAEDIVVKNSSGYYLVERIYAIFPSGEKIVLKDIFKKELSALEFQDLVARDQVKGIHFDKDFRWTLKIPEQITRLESECFGQEVIPPLL